MRNNAALSSTDTPSGNRPVPPNPQYTWSAAKSSIHTRLTRHAFLSMVPVSQPPATTTIGDVPQRHRGRP